MALFKAGDPHLSMVHTFCGVMMQKRYTCTTGLLEIVFSTTNAARCDFLDFRPIACRMPFKARTEYLLV